MSYYSLKNILKKKAVFNVIFGERSNGKTYATLKHGLEQYFKDGSQLAYVRRWKEDITGKRGQAVFSALVENNEIEKLSGGKFTGIHYYTGKFFLCNYDNGKAIYSDSDVLGFLFALTDIEHDKSTSYPKVTSIIFDEFITNRLYLPDEFVIFMNVISTIVRRREDVTIYMLGNTVNKYCPYFSEMGLNNVQDMEQGTIDLYSYGESGLTVAVEYCKTSKENQLKESKKYFAFNNPKLQMITGGAWELAIYPHLPMKYKPIDVLLTYYIEFSDNIYSCEIIEKDGVTFTYVHQKTTPIKDLDNSIIYSLEHNPKPNYNRNILSPVTNTQKKIAWYFKTHNVFYQNNSIGDGIANYLKICKGL
jgi:hypothetical protein